MTDKELLEFAAKAAGVEIEWKEWVTGRVAEFQTIKYTKHHEFWSNGKVWNPLTDDGDALRLAVKMGLLDGGLCLMINSRFNSTNMVQCYTNEKVIAPDEWMQDDPYAATRRAIVRAAAAIGESHD